MPSMTPEEILQIHKDYADQFASMAQSGLTGAFAALSGGGIFNYHPAQISITMPDFGTPKDVGALPKRPADPKLPNLGTLKSFEPIPNVGTGNNASLGSGAQGLEQRLQNPPTYNAPPEPPGVGDFTATPPADPGTPPMPSDPQFITMPSLALPVDPNSIHMPTPPTLGTANFEGVRPAGITPVDPNVIVNRYTSEVADHRNQLLPWLQQGADTLISKYAPDYHSLRAKINTAIIAYTDPTTGGGTGIPVNVENAILARNSDRVGLEFQRAISTVQDTMAKRGFTIPPGVVIDAVRQAAVGMGDAQVRGSADLATKNLELEQQQFQFMFKLGEALEEKMLDVVTQYLRLSLEMDAQAVAYAKEIVSTYIAAYNLQVLVYKALYEGYATDAEVFKARIAANESLVRNYEAQIKAEMAKVEIDSAYVGMLQAAANANLSIANAYKSQVDAALAKLEVTKIQLGIFEARARAYAAQVGAFEARWRGYAAQVEGELGKFKAYTAQAEAYVAQVQGERAKIERDIARVNAAAETNKAIGSYNESVTRVYAVQADAAISAYKGAIEGYSAESNVVIKQSDIEVEYWRTKANLIFQEFNVSVQQLFEYAREQMNLFRGQMEAAVNAANGLAHASQVAGNLAGQAMGGLTSFAGLLETKEG